MGPGFQFLVIFQLFHFLWGIKTILICLYFADMFYYKNNLIDTWVNISSVALTYLFLKGSINTKYLFHNDWDSKPSSLEQHAKDEHDDTGKVYII